MSARLSISRHLERDCRDQLICKISVADVESFFVIIQATAVSNEWFAIASCLGTIAGRSTVT
jgi:hypothetical protein